MTGTNCDLFTHNQSLSYLNDLINTSENIPKIVIGKKVAFTILIYLESKLAAPVTRLK
jgi:hypothetical protein